MRLVTSVLGVAIAILALRPISVGHAQSPRELYTGKNVDLYIVSLYQRPR
jgi:hypothetical protein